MHTRQEAFDTVVTHLLTQNARADHAGVCLYRGPKDSKCAVGALIPDDRYYHSMEGSSLNGNSAVKDVLVSSGYSTSDFSFFGVLQKVHDQDKPEAWRQALQLTAKQYKLKFNPPKGVPA